mmetsp:Transcript_10417/g.26223  ORF Transcript_10417/g.26223 Transcript_10417/m.26223 type:complete len:215 (-) Transcript_10417:195-839(-)
MHRHLHQFQTARKHYPMLLLCVVVSFGGVADLCEKAWQNLRHRIRLPFECHFLSSKRMFFPWFLRSHSVRLTQTKARIQARNQTRKRAKTMVIVLMPTPAFCLEFRPPEPTSSGYRRIIGRVRNKETPKKKTRSSSLNCQSGTRDVSAVELGVYIDPSCAPVEAFSLTRDAFSSFLGAFPCDSARSPTAHFRHHRCFDHILAVCRLVSSETNRM